MGLMKKLKRKMADYKQRSTFPMAYSQRKSGHVHNCDCWHCHHNEEEVEKQDINNDIVSDIGTTKDEKDPYC
nr:MAG TPA: hypothetical protein [Caudoviricetes sp.]